VIKLSPPLFDSCRDINPITCPEKGGNKSSYDVHEIAKTLQTTDHEAPTIGVCFSIFDEEEGSIPVFYYGISKELAEKIAFKSILSTAGVCSPAVYDEASAIIPFPEEKVLGYVLIFSLKDLQARGNFRLASLTLVYPYSDRDRLFLSFNEKKNLLSDMIVHLKGLYGNGQPIESFEHKLNELPFLLCETENKSNLADEAIATWLGKQLDAYETELTAYFNTPPSKTQRSISELIHVLGHPVNLKLLQYFHQNPTAIDSVNAIAHQIESSPASVDQAATALIKVGLLHECRMGRIRVISLNI